MQLESLEIFCDVARHRSFSDAARIWDRSQSAVSQIVSQIEKRLNVQLIDRSTRPFQLTPLGVNYFEGCCEVLDQFNELEARIRDATSTAEITGTVKVAAIYSVGLRDMGQYTDRFVSELPHAQVQFAYVHPDEVYQRVLEGTADLGLVSFPKKIPNLASIAWREEEMVLVVSPTHPLAERKSVAVGELEGLSFVHFHKDLTIRKRVDRFLRKQEVTVDVTAEFDSIENIKHAVSINAGVAILPAPTVRSEVNAHSLATVELDLCRFVRPLVIVYRRDHRLSAASKRFMDLLLLPESPTPPLNGVNGSYVNGKHPAEPIKRPARDKASSAKRSAKGKTK